MEKSMKELMGYTKKELIEILMTEILDGENVTNKLRVDINRIEVEVRNLSEANEKLKYEREELKAKLEKIKTAIIAVGAMKYPDTTFRAKTKDTLSYVSSYSQYGEDGQESEDLLLLKHLFGLAD